jgi:hypothetical protein
MLKHDEKENVRAAPGARSYRFTETHIVSSKQKTMMSYST